MHLFLKKPYFLFLFVFICLVFSLTAVERGYITNPGIVVDEAGSPVKGAYITYMDLDKRFTWSYSDENGVFGGVVGISDQLGRKAARGDLKLSVIGNKISFYAAKGERIAVDLFDIRGRSLGNVFKETGAKNGYFTVSPLDGSNRQSAHNVYVVRVSVGGQVGYVKMARLSEGRAVQSFSLNDPKTDGAMAKSTQVIDTLRVGKTEYYSKKIPISDYTEQVGNIELVKMDVAYKVDSIFNLMNADQKAGAINQPNFESVSIDYLGQNHIGTMFSGGGGTPPGGPNVPSHWADFMDAAAQSVRNSPRGIPIVCGVDNVHGLNTCETGVILPHNCTMGNTWDPQFNEKAYRMTGIEIRGTGQDWLLGPCVSVNRDDRYGRLYEGYSENPDHVAKMAKAAVLGFSGGDLGHPLTVGVCLKHFAGDGGPDGGSFAGNTTGNDEGFNNEELEYVHLLPYIECFKVYAISVMAQFGSWLGTSCHNNTYLLIDWLRDQQNFQGWTNGDWGAHFGQFQYGLQVAMNSGNAAGVLSDAKNYYNSNPDAELGIRAVKNVLTPKMWLFGDNGFTNWVTNREVTALVGCDEHREIGREAVRKGCVLVKNNGVLPISRTTDISCIGRFMNDIGCQCGGWTLSWQSDVDVPGGTTLYQGLQQGGDGNTVNYSESGTGSADICVVAIGETPYAETSFSNISISGGNLVTTCKGAGKQVVLVVVSGRPVDITSLVDQCDAIIIAMWPGSEGQGLADLIYDNEYDFTGKLAWTWPRDLSQEPINWGYPDNGAEAYGSKDPVWPFGYGLNYQGDVFTAEDGYYSENSVESLME